MASYTYELAELGDDAHGLGCKCCRFTAGTDLPIPSKLTNEELERHAIRFSTSILKDWTALNAIIKRFEATIQKRWLKKTVKQRRDVLLNAWPDMARGHRPDFASFRKAEKNAPRSRTLLTRAYLWPFINLEDLQQPHPLLLFLRSRGRNLPWKFVLADIETAHLGPGWTFEKPADAPTMHILNKCTPRSYGVVRVVPGCNTSKMQRGMIVSTRNGKSNGPPPFYACLGLLGLEIQKEIYKFLLRCARLILHDVESSQFLLAPHQPTPPSLMSKKTDFRTLQDHALEQPYLVPQELDLDRLTQLVAARRASAEDHLWLLMEDPSYFIDTLKDEKEHVFENHACETVWKRAAGYMVKDALTYFILWDDVYRKMRRMPSLDKQFKNATRTSFRLPKGTEELWASLDSTVSSMLEIPYSRLGGGFPSSPRMRCYYGETHDPKRSPSKIWALKLGSPEAARRVDLVFRSLVNEEQRCLHGLNHLVQEAQYMLDTEPAASDLVDSWVRGHFYDLALLSELQACIDSFQPWASGWRASGVNERKTVVDSVEKVLKWDMLLCAAITDTCETTKDLCDPMSSHWRYPADKRATKESIEQMRHAEGHLDDFWNDLEECVFTMTFGLSVGGLLVSLALEPRRPFYRTPVWKEKTTLPKTGQQPQSDSVLNPIDTNNAHSTTCSESAKTPRKVKVKTRGISGPAAGAVAAIARTSEADDQPSKPKLLVPKRAYKVLNAVLPPQSAEHHHRTEVAWDEFLNAMNAIGLEPEKLYGSVWMFKPLPDGLCKVKLGLNRSIQFHEPKEVRKGSKIPPYMVRAFGRRLKHAFGWSDGPAEAHSVLNAD